MTRLLIVDLETTSLKVEEAEIAVFGAYDPALNKFYVWRWNHSARTAVIKLLEETDIVVTWNGDAYDLPILERHGVVAYCTKIDALKVFGRRQTLIQYGGFKSLKLKNIATALAIADVYGGKGEIDYKIFRKETWTPEEQREIIKYVKQDLLLTAKLWEFLTQKFEVLASWLPPEDAARFKHVSTSPGSCVYKAVCYACGLPEEYEDDENVKRQYYVGAYVTDPLLETVRGTKWQ